MENRYDYFQLTELIVRTCLITSPSITDDFTFIEKISGSHQTRVDIFKKAGFANCNNARLYTIKTYFGIDEKKKMDNILK
jgi:hypothetical protein